MDGDRGWGQWRVQMNITLAVEATRAENVDQSLKHKLRRSATET